MDELLFGSYGVYLHNALFFNWSYSAADSECPAVSFPEGCLVGRFARPVIYYVARWIVFSMKLARGIASAERQMFSDFVAHNSLDAEVAKSAGLPTSLVDRRKKKRGAKMYCSKQFYDFICLLESVYLNNLNLEMMMAHPSGGLVHKIKEKILLSETVLSKMQLLCEFENEVLDHESVKRLLDYIAKNMQT